MKVIRDQSLSEHRDLLPHLEGKGTLPCMLSITLKKNSTEKKNNMQQRKWIYVQRNEDTGFCSPSINNESLLFYPSFSQRGNSTSRERTERRAQGSAGTDPKTLRENPFSLCTIFFQHTQVHWNANRLWYSLMWLHTSMSARFCETCMTHAGLATGTISHVSQFQGYVCSCMA